MSMQESIQEEKNVKKADINIKATKYEVEDNEKNLRLKKCLDQFQTEVNLFHYNTTETNSFGFKENKDNFNEEKNHENKNTNSVEVQKFIDTESLSNSLNTKSEAIIKQKMPDFILKEHTKKFQSDFFEFKNYVKETNLNIENNDSDNDGKIMNFSGDDNNKKTFKTTCEKQKNAVSDGVGSIYDMKYKLDHDVIKSHDTNKKTNNLEFSPTITTLKNLNTETIKLQTPTFIDLLTIDNNNTTEKKNCMTSFKDTSSNVISTKNYSNKDKSIILQNKHEKINDNDNKSMSLPVIALNISLSDFKNPDPGRSDVVINVLKLAEKTYGWSTLHPSSKSAYDILDGVIDDEEDLNVDPYDDEYSIDYNINTPTTVHDSTKKNKIDDDILTDKQLLKRHETKMNRKVGKYDFEDPFIDDEELLMEEITSTKDGFFVYWGLLFNNKNNNEISSKKISLKTKKN